MISTYIRGICNINWIKFFFKEVVKLFIINGFVDNFNKKLDLARLNKYNV